MVAKAPASFDLASTLARDWAVQVNTGTADTPEWVYVRGLSQFAPQTTPNMQDDSDIDSEGYTSQIATTIEMTFAGEGRRKGEKAEGIFNQDPGQSFLRAAGRRMGQDNIVHARCWRTDGVQEGYDSRFSVSWEDTAGANADLDAFSFTLMSRGKPMEIQPVENDQAESIPVDGGATGGETTNP